MLPLGSTVPTGEATGRRPDLLVSGELADEILDWMPLAG
jgi:hypothetical protein